MVAIQCLAYLDPSIISATGPQFFLKKKSLTSIDVPSLRAEAMRDSVGLLDVNFGLQNRMVGMEL